MIKESVQSVVTLGNVNQLTASILAKVLGDEVADTINGSPISAGVIYNLTQAKAQALVSPILGAAQDA